ncbi:MAG TPA: hypothetical protein ENJ24_04235, partial [Gammaproteobacteria bacterium]|nr:hypothetical protein [Gammaproteobacteria bacterium]
MNFPKKTVFSFLVALLVLVVEIDTAEAIPAFSRQTSQSCSSCHSQHFPTLNAFGRMFKANGYTMVAGQKTVEGKDVSLPQSLNLALVGALQYIKGKEETET